LRKFLLDIQIRPGMARFHEAEKYPSTQAKENRWE